MDALAPFETPAIQPGPVKLIFEDNTASSENPANAPSPPLPRYDPDSPRRYQLHIPVRLPFTLRPDVVAPPPYYPEPPGEYGDGLYPHRDAYVAVLRPVLAGALRALLGADAPVSRMVDDAHLGEGYVGAVIADREVNMDMKTGRWKDQHGREGCGVDAYWAMGTVLTVVEFLEFRVSWCVGADDVDPPIVKLVGRNELDENGNVVFDVSELPERSRLWHNRMIREWGYWDNERD
jgi:hypothetical protein